MRRRYGQLTLMLTSPQLLHTLTLLTCTFVLALTADAAGASTPAPPATSDALMANAATFRLSVNIWTS